MESLWAKERSGDNAMYIDPFVSIRTDYATDMKVWEQTLADLRSDEKAHQSKKCNKVAGELIGRGNDELRNRNWNEALNLHSRALCFAEKGTLYEGLAHGNRALDFIRLGVYNKAKTDFDLAIEKKCPEQFLANMQTLRAECQQMKKKSTKTKKRTPKLSLAADRKFPCMANVLEIQRNKDFGRCIVAKRDIDIGETVMVAECFASTLTTDNQAYCLTCQKVEMNFIPCSSCSDVMFCGEDCANWNNVHKLECGTFYHHIDDIELKFVIQTILVAVDIFPNIDNLITFVEHVTSDKGCDKIPKASHDQQSKYAIFLKLTLTHKEQCLMRAYQAFTCVLSMPKIKYLFDTEYKQRFLMHLLVQHAVVIPKNAFQDQARFTESTTTIQYIFDVLSIINHSCAPNLSYSLNGKFGHCISVRPIKKGDQVFINYLGDDVNQPLEQRQKMMKNIWSFDCKCDKCNDCSNPIESEAMKSDPSLKYVIRNYENNQISNDNTKRLQLRKQCIKFLKKYGHHPWNSELDIIINCFTTL